MSQTPTEEKFVDDLMLVVGVVGVAALILLLPGIPRPLEWLVGVPFLLVVPGYALVSALLPAAPTAEGGPSWPIRLALSLVLSVVVVASIGVYLSASWGIRLVPVIVAITAVTTAGLLVAQIRRQRIASHRRAAPFRGGVTGVFQPIASAQRPLAIILAIGVLVGTVAFVGAVPGDQQPYTEFAVLSDNGTDEAVAAGYPTTFVAGDGQDLQTVIVNHEQRRMTYDVVVRAVPPQGGTAEIVDQFRVRVPSGERGVVERTIAPDAVGSNVTLQFLLYKDGVPSNPDPGSADIGLRLYADVVEQGESAATSLAAPF